MIEEVFIAEHNDCIYESAYSIISIHKTEYGANISLMAHKENRGKYFQEMYEDIEDEIERNKEIFSSLKMEDWRVRKVKLSK